MRYAIFGTGRVGANVAAYIRRLGHEVMPISHAEASNEASRCRALIKDCDVVAAAIPDGALSSWTKNWKASLEGKQAIHFSGALIVVGLYSYHPLYSFPQAILPPETMTSIAIARQEGAPPFSEIVPGAVNPEFVVADADRAYYHALAVLSGNFAAFLWNESAKAVDARLGIKPADIMASYLRGVVDRFTESPFDSLTGPVARRDRATAQANLDALQDDPKLHALYEAFLQTAWPEFFDAN